MDTLTVSNSGTAWIRDMQAQGKSPAGGWASSPDAAYYASLDTDQALPNPATALPKTMTDLLKLRAAADGKDGAAVDNIQQQLKTLASDNALPPSGNVINVTA